MSFIKKIFLIAIYSLIYVKAVELFLNASYNFKLLNIEHWQYIWDQWNSGWTIKSSHEFILVATLLLFVPVWLIGAVILLFLNTNNLKAFVKRKYGERKQRKMVQKAIADAKKPKKPEPKAKVGTIDQKAPVNSNEAKNAFNKKVVAMAAVVKKKKKKSPIKALEINQNAPMQSASPTQA